MQWVKSKKTRFPNSPSLQCQLKICLKIAQWIIHTCIVNLSMRIDSTMNKQCGSLRTRKWRTLIVYSIRKKVCRLCSVHVLWALGSSKKYFPLEFAPFFAFRNVFFQSSIPEFPMKINVNRSAALTFQSINIPNYQVILIPLPLLTSGEANVCDHSGSAVVNRFCRYPIRFFFQPFISFHCLDDSILAMKEYSPTHPSLRKDSISWKAINIHELKYSLLSRMMCHRLILRWSRSQFISFFSHILYAWLTIELI